MNVHDLLQSGLLEAYVLGQGSADERALVERMAQQHPEVRAELDALERDLEKIAMAGAVPPPPGVKQHILNEIGRSPAPTIPMPNGSPLLRLLPAAAAVLIAAFTTFQWYAAEKRISENQEQIAALQNRLDDCSAKEKVLQNVQQAVAMLRDPDTKAVRMSNDKDYAYMYHNAVRGETGLDVSGMPLPPSGRYFQAWAIVEGKPVSLGMVDLKAPGGWQMLPYNTNAAAFAISAEENPQGNPTPTVVVMVGNAG